MSTGMKIKLKRIEMGLTAKELAEQVGITNSYLSSIEHDKFVPSLKVLRRLAKVFNCSVFNFIEE